MNRVAALILAMSSWLIPLFKGGNREDKNCYRPISLLPTISKIFERILAKRLISFFTKFDILSKDQFGFRAKFSTEYAIADIYDKLINNLDKRLSSCAIFLDLAKAFDSVSHEILGHYKFEPWFTSRGGINS